MAPRSKGGVCVQYLLNEPLPICCPHDPKCWQTCIKSNSIMLIARSVQLSATPLLPAAAVTPAVRAASMLPGPRPPTDDRGRNRREPATPPREDGKKRPASPLLRPGKERALATYSAVYASTLWGLLPPPQVLHSLDLSGQRRTPSCSPRARGHRYARRL